MKKVPGLPDRASPIGVSLDRVSSTEDCSSEPGRVPAGSRSRPRRTGPSRRLVQPGCGPGGRPDRGRTEAGGQKQKKKNCKAEGGDFRRVCRRRCRRGALSGECLRAWRFSGDGAAGGVFLEKGLPGVVSQNILLIREPYLIYHGVEKHTSMNRSVPIKIVHLYTHDSIILHSLARGLCNKVPLQWNN